MEDLVLVSDLHVGAGYDRARGMWDAAEAFFYDRSFSAFVDHLLTRADEERRSWRLVLLGDVFDFRLVDIPPPSRSAVLANSGASAISKLDQMASGHPDFFAGLRRFLAAGFPIDVVSGNHDVDLVRPAVRTRLRELLGTGGGEGDGGGVRFHPWIYYVPGVLYAEHGHQHAALSAFTRVVAPYLPGDPETIETTVGAFLVQYLLALDACSDPCPDHTTPPSRYFRLAVAHDPSSLVPVLSRQAHLLVDLMSHAAELSRSGGGDHRAGYREATLPRYAAEIGLPRDVVEALDDLTVGSRRSLPRRMATAAARRSAASRAARASLVAAVAASPSKAGRLARAAVAAVALRDPGRRLGHRSANLERAAVSVHRLLRRAGLAVPYYVFGHDHRPQHLPLQVGP